MTYLPEDPQPELSTTRVSSGSAARLGIALMAGMLVVVVGFVVVNRPPPPLPPAPTDAAVAVAPTLIATPAAEPTPVRNQLEGNDGIYGWPTIYQLAYLTANPHANYDGPRGFGLFNRCRWGDGPQGAPPRGNHDEAGCLDS
ncbi:MAG TPA: hypothetical protein VM284_05100 [Candidatus Limnocylindria bacterium]|nr:hypothetical protein [Candidatus Limnocylindria bacterium]